MVRNTFAEIDLGAIADNFNSMRHLLGTASFICPMVKANAYGHGDLEVAKTLEQQKVKYLGVGLLEEGIRLRTAGIECQVLNFGVFGRTAVPELEHFRLTPVLSTWEQVEALETCLEHPMRVHLKFDTGMHRLGFPLEEANKLVQHLEQSQKLQLVGLCTHMQSGQDLGEVSGRSDEQIKKFLAVSSLFAKWKPLTHALNSAATLNAFAFAAKGSSKYLGLGSRPGLSLYGLRSTNQFPELNLRPALSLRTEVVRWVKVPAGEGVSYDGIWSSPRPSIVGVLPIGYADGYTRFLSNRGEVLFRGQKLPVVGRVCMDYIMFDATSVFEHSTAPPSSSEEVVLIGEQLGQSITADDWANKAQTISYEVLTQISARVPRLFKFGAAAGRKYELD